jgi:hypothetical protein
MVREYFKQLDLSALPVNASNYISKEILTDLDLDLLSEDDELFQKVKNKLDSMSHKEVTAVSEEVAPSEGAWDRFKEKMDKTEDQVNDKASWEGLKILAETMITVSEGAEKQDWTDTKELAVLMLAD